MKWRGKLALLMVLAAFVGATAGTAAADEHDDQCVADCDDSPVRSFGGNR